MVLFCFKQQQEAEVPCSQLAKKFRIRARKKIGKGEGEKRKKVAKTQVSKYIRKHAASHQSRPHTLRATHRADSRSAPRGEETAPAPTPHSPNQALQELSPRGPQQGLQSGSLGWLLAESLARGAGTGLERPRVTRAQTGKRAAR